MVLSGEILSDQLIGFYPVVMMTTQNSLKQNFETSFEHLSFSRNLGSIFALIFAKIHVIIFITFNFLIFHMIDCNVKYFIKATLRKITILTSK